MQFASLGSGSKGNGTLIRFQDTLVLVDCGFTVKDTERRLARLGVHGADLDAILVTHEHGDHINGVGGLARRYDLPVYLTAGTFKAGKLGKVKQVFTISQFNYFQIKSLEVVPVAVPHDSREACQFVIHGGDLRLGILTDCGSLTPHILHQYRQCDALLLECNHDPEMLAKGPYPANLKRRVGGDFGHLSNHQAAEFLRSVACERLKHLVVTHISEQNNQPQLAIESITGIAQSVQNIPVIDQEMGLDWQTLSVQPELTN